MRAAVEGKAFADALPPDPNARAARRLLQWLVEEAPRVIPVQEAAQWLEQNAAKYNVDAGRLFIGGSSAGAVTSMLLAYNPEIRAPHFRAVADMWGTMGPRVGWLKKGGAPLLIIHGREDETITVSAAEQIDARARQIGLVHETIQRRERACGQQFQIAHRSLRNLDRAEFFRLPLEFGFLLLSDQQIDQCAAVRRYQNGSVHLF